MRLGDMTSLTGDQMTLTSTLNKKTLSRFENCWKQLVFRLFNEEKLQKIPLNDPALLSDAVCVHTK